MLGDTASGVVGCALLFGIPVDQHDFDYTARPDGRSDYMIGMLRGREPTVAWHEGYLSVAGAAQGLIQTARRLHTAVYERATLRCVSEATRHFHTVILFTHWRGAMFRDSDFRADADTICKRMDEDPILRNIKLITRDLDGVVDALNTAVYSADLLPVLPRLASEAGFRSRVMGQTLCRDLIDECFAGLAVPGNRLELSDGLHTPAAFEEAIWSDYSGTLDLALCNSEALATMIDLRRRNSIRKLFWPDLLDPVPQFLKVQKTLQFMVETGIDYASMRLNLEEDE